MKRITSMAAAFAAAASFWATPAAAQDASALQDLDPAAVASATRYALPLAFEGYMTRCFEALDSDGYSITNADALRAKFADGADEAWPGARALMLDMAREEAGEMTSILEMFGDEELRPIVDALLTNLVATEIEDKDCASVERGLEILDPLPADNFAMMIGFIIELVQESENLEGERVVDLPPQGEPEMTESRRRKLREQEEERRQ